MHQHFPYVLQDGYISGQQVGMLNNKLLDLLVAIRPNAVAVVFNSVIHINTNL